MTETLGDSEPSMLGTSERSTAGDLLTDGSLLCSGILEILETLGVSEAITPEGKRLVDGSPLV